MEYFCGYPVLSIERHPVDDYITYLKVGICGVEAELYDDGVWYSIYFDPSSHWDFERVPAEHISDFLFSIELRVMVQESGIEVSSTRVSCDYEFGTFWFHDRDQVWRYVWDYSDKWYRALFSENDYWNGVGNSKSLRDWMDTVLVHSVEYDKVGIIIKGELKTFDTLGEIQEYVSYLEED